jgi:hypothetical protein
VNRFIVGSLVACVMISAIGGYGALLCRGDQPCIDAVKTASAGALAGAGTLGTLLARISGSDPHP